MTDTRPNEYREPGQGSLMADIRKWIEQVEAENFRIKFVSLVADKNNRTIRVDWKER